MIIRLIINHILIIVALLFILYTRLDEIFEIAGRTIIFREFKKDNFHDILKIIIKKSKLEYEYDLINNNYNSIIIQDVIKKNNLITDVRYFNDEKYYCNAISNLIYPEVSGLLFKYIKKKNQTLYISKLLFKIVFNKTFVINQLRLIIIYNHIKN